MISREKFHPLAALAEETEKLVLKSISPEEVPSVVLDSMAETVRHFFRRGIDHLPPLIEPSVIEHTDGTKTFIGTFNTHSGPDRDLIADVTFVADLVDDKYAGRAVIVHRGERFDYGIVARSWTEPSIQTKTGTEEIRGRGLAERRYHIMNQVCKRKYGTPLHSGGTNQMSKPLWEKLVKQGFAERVADVEENDSGEFRFKRQV